MSIEDDRILLVDDERYVLDGLYRQHHARFNITRACGPEEGLRVLREDRRFKVVVSDYQMPGMHGAAFLSAVATLCPSTVRMMLTGQADLSAAIEAINRGHIFRFLTKPCDAETFELALDAALEQYDLRHAEARLLRETLQGSIEVLGDVLALSNPAAFGRGARLRALVRGAVEALGLEDGWQYESAALLSQIGCIAVPDTVLSRVAAGAPVDAEAERMLVHHPEVARDLLRKIPRLERVAEMVGSLSAGAGQGAAPQVQLGHRLLTAARELDELLALGASRAQAAETLKSRAPKYGQSVVDALCASLAEPVSSDGRVLPVWQIEVGMVVEEDVRTREGGLLVPRGFTVSDSLLARLRNHALLHELAEDELRVRVDGAGARSDASAA